MWWWWGLLPFISVSTLSRLSVSESGLPSMFSAASAFGAEELLAGSVALGFAGPCFLAAVFPSTTSIFTGQRVCRRPIVSKFSSEHWPRLLKSSNTWGKRNRKQITKDGTPTVGHFPGHRVFRSTKLSICKSNPNPDRTLMYLKDLSSLMFSPRNNRYRERSSHWPSGVGRTPTVGSNW